MIIVRGPVEFDMGEPPSQHRERIPDGFAIATTEVTVQQFQGFRKDDPRFQVNLWSPEPTCPMSAVSWYDAVAYCNWLSKQEGIAEDQWCYGPNEKGDYAEGMNLMPHLENRKGYRLPTEAEWEYSCRAGAATGYSFGGRWELLEKYGWYFANSPYRTQPVGSLRPNDLGLFDFHGNIWEWCHDARELPGKPETEAQTKNEHTDRSIVISNKVTRLLRGGTFNLGWEGARSDYRLRWEPASRRDLTGFRLARTYN
jgi:formylglycine-generating enzyme required for sulfatase activity